MKALILLILSFTTAYAQKQITGRVINERTKEAVPFATVTFLNTKNGTNADVNGVFTLKGSEKGGTDSLLVAAIGYTPLKLALNDLTRSSEVSLREDVKTLKEVNISDKRKELMIGNYNSASNIKFANTGVELAKRFEMPASHQYLKEIRIMRDLTFFPHSPETRFRINIYNENRKTKGPGEKICVDTIEVNDLDNTQITIDVSKYNISVLSSPFFVAVETLLIPFNERYRLFRAGKVEEGIREYPAYYEIFYQPYVSVGRAKDNEGWVLALKPGSKWEEHWVVPAIKVVVN